jgi:hypothetical protein
MMPEIVATMSVNGWVSRMLISILLEDDEVQ